MREPLAVYEPADRFLFSPQPTEGPYGKPYEIGTHGLWPARPDYRSVFVMWAPDIRAEKLPEMSMLGIFPHLLRLLGITPVR